VTDSTSATAVRAGSCLCRLVTFTAAGEPDDPHICGCAHCSKRSGSPFQWWVGFPTERVSWTGESELVWYDTHPGACARGFCGRCGTHLAARDHGDDSVTGFLVTAFDDPADPVLAPTNLNRLAQAATWLSPAA
jgi:hypothetical protein